MSEITETVARKVLTTVDAGLVKGVGEPKPGMMCVEAAVCYALGLPHGDEPECVSRTLRQLKIRLNDSNWSSDQARAKGLRRLALAQLGSAGKLDDKGFAKSVAEMAIRKAVPYALWCAAKIQKDAKHRQALLDAAHRCEREGTREASRAAAAVAASSAAYAAANAAADAADAASSAADAASSAANAAANADANAANAAANAAYAVAASSAANAASSAANAAANAAYAAANAKKRDKVLSKFAEEVVQILIDMKAPGCQWLWMTEAA